MAPPPLARFRTYTINGSGVVNGTGAALEIGFIAQAWYNFLGQVGGGPGGAGAARQHARPV